RAHEKAHLRRIPLLILEVLSWYVPFVPLDFVPGHQSGFSDAAPIQDRELRHQRNGRPVILRQLHLVREGFAVPVATKSFEESRKLLRRQISVLLFLMNEQRQDLLKSLVILPRIALLGTVAVAFGPVPGLAAGLLQSRTCLFLAEPDFFDRCLCKDDG